MTEAIPRNYLVFDCTIRSDVALPGVATVDVAKPDLQVRRVDDAGVIEGELHWYHDWPDANGRIAIRGARCGWDYLLRFPGLADFRIDPERGLVQVVAPRSSTETTLAHLLLDQVLPRLLCHQGRMIVHASAVRLPDGRAVAFLGNSGRGKSTLASYFYRHGAGLITDDSLLLVREGANLLGIPAYPSLRLWPDASQAIFSGTRRFSEMAHYSGKGQLFLQGDERAASGRAPLAALFVLGAPADATAGDDIQVESLSGARGFMACIEAALVLDVDDRDAVRAHFERTSNLAGVATAIYALNYERRYELLPEVRRAIKAAVYDPVAGVASSVSG